MLKQKDIIKDRINKVMLSDRIEGLETLLTVLKSDLKVLLANYMALEDDGFKLALEILPDGKYLLNVSVQTIRLIEPGRMIRD